MRSAGDFWGGFSRHYRPVIQNKKLCSTVGMADRRYTPENIARYPKVGYVLILLDLLFIAWSLLTHPLGGAGSTPVIAVNGR